MESETPKTSTKISRKKSSRALDLLIQNPGLTLHAAAQFVGTDPKNLLKYLRKQASLGAGKCPTCHRKVLPSAHRKRAFTPDQHPLTPDIAYDKMLRADRKACHNQLNAEEKQTLAREAILTAERRLKGQMGTRAKQYVKNAHWRVSSIAELTELL